MKAAYLGLDFFSRECYAIPYGNRLQFQTDYKGEVKLAKKYSFQKIRDIYAKVVREGDAFEEIIYHGKPTINFQPKPFNSGKIIGAFAVCLYGDGTMIYETMSAEDINSVRDNYSKMANGKAWKQSYGEMAKKTVIRRLRKMIPIEFDNPEQIEAYDDGGDAQFVDAEEVHIEPIRMPEPTTADPDQPGPEKEPKTKKQKSPRETEAVEKYASPQLKKAFAAKERDFVYCIKQMLWEMADDGSGNQSTSSKQSEAGRLLYENSTFEGKDGKMVDGFTSFDYLETLLQTDAERLRVLYGIIKNKYLHLVDEIPAPVEGGE